MTYSELWHQLTPLYGEGEAKAMARILFEDCFRLSLADVLAGADRLMSENEQARLCCLAGRLLRGEPLQYVVGSAMFGNHRLKVTPAVLIPRPETEQLCQLCLDSVDKTIDNMRLLDIGTGSGCIAITLSLALKQAEVEGWDISADALSVARQNADSLQANVVFRQCDILSNSIPEGRWHAIVSNPPYICNEEQKEMSRVVVDNEPHEALFVPDSDPLLFYRAIARYASSKLLSGGGLFFEINPRFSSELADMLKGLDFVDIEVKTDLFGKERFITCQRK